MKYNVKNEKIITDITDYEKENFENLKIGFENLKKRCKNLNEKDLRNLLALYSNLSIIIDKSIKDYSKEIAYPCQDMKEIIYVEIKNRINLK